VLSEERFNQLEVAEQFILTLTENGYGKRSSAYEYRTTNRGGSGIVNIVTNERNGMVISSFPIESNEQIMLMTDKAKIIRCPVHDIRIAGRNTQGVTIFKIAKDEHVASSTQIDESMLEDDEEEGKEAIEEAVDAGAAEEA
jgi:DNA gyrase subunit A